MSTYNCYEQRKPIGGKEIEVAPGVVVREYQPNLVLIGQLNAPSAEHAIQAARRRYRIRWPMVSVTREEVVQ